MNGLVWLSISGIIADLILLFVISGNAVFGYRVGLARVFCGFVSSIAAIILVLILYKPVSGYLINNTPIPEKFESFFCNKLQTVFERENVDPTSIESVKENEGMYAILKVFVGDKIGTAIENTKNNVIEYLSEEITIKIINILTFFILFAVIRLILYVLRTYIEAVASIPVIRIFNGIGGMIYGVIRGFFIIYIILAIISILNPIIGNNIIATAIQDSAILSKMFNNNILLKLIVKN